MNRHAQITDMKVSDAVRKLNPDFFVEAGRDGLPVANAKACATKPRLRQDRKGPNKLEAEFEAWLREEWKNDAGVDVLAQAVTLSLANGVRYTPDFVVKFTSHGMRGAVQFEAVVLHAYETKGFMREDASVKIKVAAHQYPWIKFHLVTKRKKKDGGGWAIEEVLP